MANASVTTPVTPFQTQILVTYFCCIGNLPNQTLSSKNRQIQKKEALTCTRAGTPDRELISTAGWGALRHPGPGVPQKQPEEAWGLQEELISKLSPEKLEVSQVTSEVQQFPSRSTAVPSPAAISSLQSIVAKSNFKNHFLKKIYISFGFIFFFLSNFL